METMYPDYQNGIVNLACSMLRHYTGQCPHPTLPLLDRYLEKGYRNVLLLLFDGLGTDALRTLLPKDSFLRRHFLQHVSSVFPPTTTAATGSIESGLYPSEHGWLGWSLYFHEIDSIINIFPNTVKGSEAQAADYHVAGRLLPYPRIQDAINRTGSADAYCLSPFGGIRIETLDALKDNARALCRQDGRKFIYAYWPQPDGAMHETGSDSGKVREIAREIDACVEDLCADLTDTLIVATADHGHIDVDYRFVCDHPRLMETLLRPISLESRAAAFYVREECREDFPALFFDAFGADFLLLSQQEALSRSLFGGGEPHPRMRQFIGDFLAIAVSDKALAYGRDAKPLLSNHAGLTKKEMQVPLIVAERP